MAYDVSIAVYNNIDEAHLSAGDMRQHGFVVQEVLKVTDGINWNNLTKEPKIEDEVETRAWLVIGYR